MDNHNSTKPLISIITVCFNSAKTIRQTIESVLNQTYTNIEYILIDGKSTDNTVAIIQEYAPLFAAKGIAYRWVSEPDNGIYDAMNKGIKLATGEWIGIINSDDYFVSNVVFNDLSQLMSTNSFDAFYSDLCYIDSNGNIQRYWKSGIYNSKSFNFGWMPPHPTFVVKRSVYEKYGNFRLDLGSSADYELMLRFLLKHGIRAKWLPKITIYMRIGGISNQSLNNRMKANDNDRKAWLVNQLKPAWYTLYLKPIRKVSQFFLKPKKIDIET